MRLRYSDNNERLRTSGADTVGTQTKPGTDEVFSPAVYVEEVASDEWRVASKESKKKQIPRPHLRQPVRPLTAGKRRLHGEQRQTARV